MENKHPSLKQATWAVLFAGVLGFGSLVATAIAEPNGRGDSPRTEWIIQRQSSRLEADRQAKLDAEEAERIKMEQMERDRQELNRSGAVKPDQEKKCYDC